MGLIIVCTPWCCCKEYIFKMLKTLPSILSATKSGCFIIFDQERVMKKAVCSNCYSGQNYLGAREQWGMCNVGRQRREGKGEQEVCVSQGRPRIPLQMSCLSQYFTGDELMQKPCISVHAVIVHPIPPEYRWKWEKGENAPWILVSLPSSTCQSLTGPHDISV